jgi:hypothetical protein
VVGIMVKNDGFEVIRMGCGGGDELDLMFW